MSPNDSENAVGEFLNVSGTTAMLLATLTLLAIGLGLRALYDAQLIVTRPEQAWLQTYAKGDPSSSMAFDENMAVTLERFGCFGDCPRYRVTITAQGAVTWLGQAHVCVLGERRRQIEARRVQPLMAGLIAVDFSRLRTSSRWHMVDGEMRALTLTRGGSTQRLDFSEGDPDSSRLVDWITAAIDDTAETQEWIGPVDSDHHPCPSLATMAIGYGDPFITDEGEIADPIAPGATCTVPFVLSVGSYIFDWPSVFDQSYWPYNSPDMIWFCPTSGFASLPEDIDDLTAADKKAISSFNARHYRRTAEPPSIPELMRLMEQTYRLRKKDLVSQIGVLKALAYMHESEGFQSRATTLRREALRKIHTALKTDLSHRDRMELLFVCASYEQEFGDDLQSDRHRNELRALLDRVTDPELAGYRDYLRGHMASIPYLKPGGRFLPEYGVTTYSKTEPQPRITVEPSP